MKALLKLSVPTSAMFLGLMLMGLVDLLFVGQLGPAALGGLGLGNSIFSWVMTVGIGMIWGLDFPIAQAIGEEDRGRAWRLFVQGVRLAALISVPAMAAILLAAYFLDRFGLNPEVVPYARRYLVATAISFFPVFLFNAAKSYLQAQAIAIPTFVVLVLANILNYVLSAGFMEGRFGFPEYGYDGLALATVIGRFAMAAALVGYVVWRHFRAGLSFAFGFERALFAQVVRLGGPASAQMLLEVGVFSLSTAMAAMFSSIDLAAHQIVLNTASMLFMIPLGIGSAAGSLVGQAYGAEDWARAKRTGYSALALGLGFAVVSSGLLIVFADAAMGIYTRDAAVIEAAKKLLFVAALFQISDGVQAIATGALRGLGNTVSAAIANGVGHWLVGLPLGILLGFGFQDQVRGLGVEGIWIGLATGLTVVAVWLGIRWAQAISSVRAGRTA